ncbi:MAG: hypothetical protein R3D62_03235 [Xanthobacteraceae bacterium]
MTRHLENTMSPSKIALFAFGLAAVLVAGFQQADAAPRWANGYHSTISPGEALFQRAKGNPQGY